MNTGAMPPYLQVGDKVIPGVKYVAAGLATMSDFAVFGWSYVHP